MIIFSATVQALMASKNAEFFYLLLIKNGDGSLFRASTTHFSNITMEDGFTYLADGYIISVDPPQQSTTVDREQYKIVLADPEMTEAENAENVLLGKKLECRLGFFNKSTGEILTDMDDTFVVYKGRVDGTVLSIDTEEIGESTFSIAGSSPMAALDMTKGMYLSRDYIRNRRPKDSCCDQIHAGSVSITLKWGKK